ncbi:Surfactin synthase subunit 2 [compost metagenome]
MDRLPLTPNGKIDRKALPVPINNNSSETEYIAPSTDVQKLLAELWSTVIHIERVGIYDHFFELGGDSIKAIQVASRLLEAGYKVEIKHLFSHPVIADLCDYVQSVE